MAKGGAMVIGYTAVGDYLLPNIAYECDETLFLSLYRHPHPPRCKRGCRALCFKNISAALEPAGLFLSLTRIPHHHYRRATVIYAA